jgi:purine-binding chemotaxis protein CheW
MKDTPNSKLEPQNFDWEGVRQRIAEANAALAGLDETSPEVVQQIWARRAAQLAQVPVQEEEGEQIELVLVQLGREIYGLDAQCVYDIRPAEQITRVPRVPDWVAGVVNLRGRILSVIDLGHFFGLSRAEMRGLAQAEANGEGEATSGPDLVVIETSDMEIALLADDVLAVEALPASQVQEATDTIRGIHPEYVRGVAERRSGDTPTNGDGLLVVLDLPALLADERLIIHEETV